MKSQDVRTFEKALWNGDFETCVEMLEKDPKAVARYTYYWGEEFGSLEAMCAQMATENCKDLRELLYPSYYR